MSFEPGVRWISAESGSRHVEARTLLERTLPKLPSLFGQLTSLANCCAPQRNCREREEQHTVADGEAERSLREAHTAIFFKWLCLSLEQQKTDLEVHAVWVNGSVSSLLESWLQPARRRRLVPDQASDAERHLFCGNLKLLLEMAKIESGEPGHSRRLDVGIEEWRHRQRGVRVKQRCCLVISPKERISVGVTEEVSRTGALIRWESPAVFPRPGDSLSLEIEFQKDRDPPPRVLACMATVAYVFMTDVDTILVAADIKKMQFRSSPGALVQRIKTPGLLMTLLL